MGEREMSATAELNATEIATRLLPLLKEYAAKMANVAETASDLWGRHALDNFTGDIGRIISLHAALDEPVTNLAREASGLIEHATLEYHLRNELKLRAEEIEEHIRFAGVLVARLVTRLKANKLLAEDVRKLIEKSGRYKAP